MIPPRLYENGNLWKTIRFNNDWYLLQVFYKRRYILDEKNSIGYLSPHSGSFYESFFFSYSIQWNVRLWKIFSNCLIRKINFRKPVRSLTSNIEIFIVIKL